MRKTSRCSAGHDHERTSVARYGLRSRRGRHLPAVFQFPEDAEVGAGRLTVIFSCHFLFSFCAERPSFLHLFDDDEIIERISSASAEMRSTITASKSSYLAGVRDSRCDQAASLSVPSAKNGRALEWTHCFSPSLITPALCRQSAFMTIRAADAASLIGKINSMSHARCMAE